MTPAIDDAVAALAGGDLAVYPTETSYGLGAAALDPDAIERVFRAKGRSRDKPISMAVQDIATAETHTELSAREREFMEAFLPGPVTVVVRRNQRVPDSLTAGRGRVGIRIPDDPIALELLERIAPITATSANVSGNASATRPGELDPEIREAAAVVIDDGPREGGGSTVVDVAHERIHRRGHQAEAVEAWLADR